MVKYQLQLGKAGEHLVCADLILSGFNAFLSDQGAQFDIVVETETGLKTVQVRTTSSIGTYGRSVDVFRFNLRGGRGNTYPTDLKKQDLYAFVALDTKQIAYMSSIQLKSKFNQSKIISTIDFRTKNKHYVGRVYSNGSIRNRYGRFIEDFRSFEACLKNMA